MEEKNLEKIQLFDAIAEAQAGRASYYIYSDYFGLFERFEHIKILELISDNNEEVSMDDLYIKEGKGEKATYTPLSELKLEENYSEIFKVLSLNLYKQKEKYEYRDYYNRIVSSSTYRARRIEKPISEENEVKVKLKEIKIGIGQQERNRYGYYEFQGWKEIFSAKTISKLNHPVWKLPKNYSAISANFALFNVGDLVWKDSVGTYKITEVYQEPNREKKLFKAESLLDGTVLEITEDMKDILCVPYLEYQSELKQFNDMLNEYALRPYAVCNDHIYNVYWLPIEDARQYVISLYKYITVANSSRLYHLQDICVDRNCRYLALDKLTGGSFIITVSAENRNGEVIAKSRGIQGGGAPKFW